MGRIMLHLMVTLELLEAINETLLIHLNETSCLH